MFRKIGLINLCFLVLMSFGCRACYSPYDLCQPTFVPARGDACMNELYRSGSVFVDPAKSIEKNSGCKTCSSELPYSATTAQKNGYISRTATSIPNLEGSEGVSVRGENLISKGSPLDSMNKTPLLSENVSDGQVVDQFELQE